MEKKIKSLHLCLLTLKLNHSCSVVLTKVLSLSKPSDTEESGVELSSVSCNQPAPCDLLSVSILFVQKIQYDRT